MWTVGHLDKIVNFRSRQSWPKTFVHPTSLMSSPFQLHKATLACTWHIVPNVIIGFHETVIRSPEKNIFVAKRTLQNISETFLQQKSEPSFTLNPNAFNSLSEIIRVSETQNFHSTSPLQNRNASQAWKNLSNCVCKSFLDKIPTPELKSL